MSFKIAVVLCLSFALVANAQIGTAIANDLNAKENQLNCLLGKPSCGSPPPPGAGSSPPPATPPSTPPSTPPATPPTTPPTSAPTPAPAPGPAALTGTAVVVLSLSLPDGYVLTDAARQQLVALIQAQLGDTAIVELQVTGGRKLLALTTVSLLLTEVTDCVAVGLNLEVYIPGLFVSQANGLGIPLLAASLSTFACTFPGQPPYTITNPPAMAPTMMPPSMEPSMAPSMV